MLENVFNEVGSGEFFYLPNNNRCIRVSNIMVQVGASDSEKVNYYNLNTKKFGYLSGMEPVCICKHNSRYVLSCGIEH